MRFEKLAEQRRLVVEKVLQDMEKDGLNWAKSWSTAFAPYNPVSGTRYRGMNRLLLGYIAAKRNLNDPRWVTSRQAEESGWKIKKGSKSAGVEKWKRVSRRNDLEEAGEDGEDCLTFFACVGYFNVFNAEEVEGMPPLELPEYEHDEKEAIADRLIGTSRCPIHEIATSTAAYYPQEDVVRLPLRRVFKSIEAFVRTLLHEMGHSTGHESCLARELKGRFCTEDYAYEELVAEMSALFCSIELGLDPDAELLGGEYYENHVAYLKSWQKKLREDPNDLFSAASAAEKAMEVIIGRYGDTMNANTAKVA